MPCASARPFIKRRTARPAAMMRNRLGKGTKPRIHGRQSNSAARGSDSAFRFQFWFQFEREPGTANVEPEPGTWNWNLELEPGTWNLLRPLLPLFLHFP